MSKYKIGYFDDIVDVDDYIEKNGEFISNSEIVDILNEQEEEIQELETENKQLIQFINRLITKGTGRIDLANGYSYNINAVLRDFCGDME